MTMHEKLASLLQDRKMKNIAERVGIHYSTLYLYTRGKLEPSATTMAKLAKVLGVDAGWLIDDSRGWLPELSARGLKPVQTIATPAAA